MMVLHVFMKHLLTIRGHCFNRRETTGAKRSGVSDAVNHDFQLLDQILNKSSSSPCREEVMDVAETNANEQSEGSSEVS